LYPLVAEQLTGVKALTTVAGSINRRRADRPVPVLERV
jgi:hypothetical protein